MANRGMSVSLFVAIWLAASASAKDASQLAGVAPRYSRAAETVAEGTIEQITVQTRSQGLPGYYLMLSSGNRTVTVHLGPAKSWRERRLKFSKGEQVRVLGSLVRVGDSDLLLAREVSRGGEVLLIRNANGILSRTARARR